MLARSAIDTLRTVGECWDTFLANEAAAHVADLFGYSASTITRRNEQDNRLRSYPFSDGLVIVRHYRREAPELCQRIVGYLTQQNETTECQSLADRASAAMEQSAQILTELMPLVKHEQVTEAGRSRIRRKLAEQIRTAQRLLNGIDAEAARRSA